MVDISIETVEETDARLTRVMRAARLTTFATPYAFIESAQGAAVAFAPDALACVRDGQRWSQLVPLAPGGEGEAFTVFQIHFPAGVDNSGFVGWLATLLKRRFGTGVFVICGQNSDDGGIFDYWGCPHGIGAQVVAEVRALTAGAPDD